MGIIICRGVGSHWVPIYWEKIASERERERLLHQMYSTMLFSIHYWYDHYGLWNRRVRIAIYMITVRTQQSTSMQASIPSGRLHRVLRAIGIIVLVVSIGILGTTNRGWPIALAHTFFPKHQTPNSSPDVDRGGAFLYQLDFHRNRFNRRLRDRARRICGSPLVSSMALCFVCGNYSLRVDFQYNNIGKDVGCCGGMRRR